MEKKYYFWKDNGVIWKENKIFFDKKIKKEYNTDSYSENEKEIRSFKKKNNKTSGIYIYFFKKKLRVLQKQVICRVDQKPLIQFNFKTGNSRFKSLRSRG
jgi:hypothetical protein